MISNSLIERATLLFTRLESLRLEGKALLSALKDGVITPSEFMEGLALCWPFNEQSLEDLFA